MKRLVSLKTYDHIFGPYCGSKVLFSFGPGNVGDRMIELATLQLFDYYDITVSEDNPSVAFCGGGGNMGTFYMPCSLNREKLKAKADEFGIPVIVLPQTWSGPDFLVADKYFARDRFSLLHEPKAIIAPDLGLAYLPYHLVAQAPTKKDLLFFRDDVEKTSLPNNNFCDPAIRFNYTELDCYLNLAWDFEKIHTNRLHFAIAGLIGERDVTLYANSYYKNRAVFETSLCDLGCKWGEL
jgi:exopolysaccharide biosynthesis predicted pyruvyltransferase EpsI